MSNNMLIFGVGIFAGVALHSWATEETTQQQVKEARERALQRVRDVDEELGIELDEEQQRIINDAKHKKEHLRRVLEEKAQELDEELDSKLADLETKRWKGRKLVVMKPGMIIDPDTGEAFGVPKQEWRKQMKAAKKAGTSLGTLLPEVDETSTSSLTSDEGE
jgi:hypothetical protein